MHAEEQDAARPARPFFVRHAAKVAHVLAHHHEDDHFGKVGRVVPDAFEVLGDRLRADRAINVLRILHHVSEKLAEDLRIVGVDHAIAFDDFARALGVGGHESIQRIADHRLDNLGHARQPDIGLERRLHVELDHALADVYAQVADALQVGGELERDGDKAQVGGDRLALGENAQAQLVRLDFEPVDLMIELDHAAREFGIALRQRAHAARDHLFHARAHDEQAVVQLRQFALVLAIGMGAHRFNPSVSISLKARGSVKPKVVPAPEGLRTSTLPPIASVRCFTIERPRPVPPNSRERPASTR